MISTAVANVTCDSASASPSRCRRSILVRFTAGLSLAPLIEQLARENPGWLFTPHLTLCPECFALVHAEAEAMHRAEDRLPPVTGDEKPLENTPPS